MTAALTQIRRTPLSGEPLRSARSTVALERHAERQKADWSYCAKHSLVYSLTRYKKTKVLGNIGGAGMCPRCIRERNASLIEAAKLKKKGRKLAH